MNKRQSLNELDISLLFYIESALRMLDAGNSYCFQMDKWTACGIAHAAHVLKLISDKDYKTIAHAIICMK